MDVTLLEVIVRIGSGFTGSGRIPSSFFGCFFAIGSKFPVNAIKVRTPRKIEIIKKIQEVNNKYLFESSTPPRMSFENVTVNVIIAVDRVINCLVRSTAKSKAFFWFSSIVQQNGNLGQNPLKEAVNAEMSNDSVMRLE